MKNKENYNYIINFIKKEAKAKEKQGYYVYDIYDFLLEVEKNLINGNSKIANKIYNDEIEFYKSDNSYNWYSNINDDIDYRLYNIDNKIYIKLKVHMFGDIRAHYTDDIILKFDNENEFYELLSDTTIFLKTIDIEAGEIFLECDIFDELIYVTFRDKNNNYTNYDITEIDFTLCDTIEEIKEKLNKYFSK